MIERDRMIRAVALSLANDGYIDLDRMDGEHHIYGDRPLLREGDVEAVADSLIKWYSADQELALAEVLDRRRREGRE